MSVKHLTEHQLEILSLKGGWTCSSESTHVKMPHCWKPHVAAHLLCCFVLSVPCDHLLGKGWPLECDVSCVFGVVLDCIDV